MPFVIADRTERIYPPSTLPGVSEGDWIDISTVFDARIQRISSHRASLPDGASFRWDGFGFRQAILELTIKGWSDTAPVSPEAIGAMSPEVQDWVYSEYNRLNGRRSEEEKKRLYHLALGAFITGGGGFPRELEYLMEIRWLRNQGLIGSYWEYELLPLSVVEDARLLMAAEADAREAGA